jgi:hypothetical protein
MTLLELPLKFVSLLFPLTLHISLNLIHLVLQVILGLLFYFLQSDGVLFFILLFLCFDFFIFTLILLHQICLELLFCSLLFFFESFTLLSHWIFDILLDLSFTIPNALLALSLNLLFGIFKLMVTGGSLGSLTLPITLQSHFRLIFNALSGTSDIFFLLISQFFFVWLVLTLKPCFFVLDLASEHVLLEQVDLLVNIARFF